MENKIYYIMARNATDDWIMWILGFILLVAFVFITIETLKEEKDETEFQSNLMPPSYTYK